jgi:hypothetical protein
MDLVLSGPLAKQVLVMARKDPKLALALAEQFLSTIQPLAMADYLLTQEVVTALLAERIKRNPEVTLRELQGLPTGQPRRAAQKITIAKAKSPAPKGRRRRIRLTAAQIEKLKTDVRRFLGQHPWATRKQINNAVDFPSLATYNRIMSELRSAGEAQSHGEKAKTVYALKGAAKAKAAPAKAKPGKRAKPVKKASTTKTKTKAKPAPKTKAKPAPKTKAKKAAKPAAASKPAKKAAKPSDGAKTAKPRLCPYPDCKNVAAPIFGMMCREHKDVPKPEREKYFAQRRAQTETEAKV